MNFSCLSEAEVREKYRRAEHKEVMIGILADLTCSTKREVRKFLGLPPKKDKKWNPTRVNKKLDEERAQELYDAGLSDPKIAASLGTSINAVYLWRRRNGLLSHEGQAVKARDEERWRLYNQGMTDREIAEIQGVGYKSVISWRKLRKLPPNEWRTSW